MAAGAAIRILVVISFGNRQMKSGGKASEARTPGLYHTFSRAVGAETADIKPRSERKAR
jgi:hypothetical protein